MTTNRIAHGTQKEVNVFALIKGDQRYVFIYEDSQRKEVCGYMGRWAADPGLNFSWHDAAILGKRVTEAKEAEHE